jgi:energy-coupling factor transporter ATP-binding protein EcfA2
MLIDLKIINFQKHEKFKLKLDRITTFVGPSDSGKSAVLRALKWVLLNRPSGDSFIREGSDKARVVLGVDGCTIERSRGKGRNIYRLDGGELKAFNDKVPDSVKRLLAVSDMNFQNQHDSPFWFADSPGEVSRQLNEIVNLGLIDSVLGYLGSAAREASAMAAVVESRMKEAKAERTKWAAAVAMNVELAEVERLSEQADETAASATLLGKLCQEALTLAQVAESASEAAIRGELAVEKGIAWAELHRHAQELANLAENISSLLELSNVYLPDLGPLEILAERLEKLGDSKELLDGLLASAKHCKSILDKATADALAMSDSLREQLGKVCPLCDQRTE